MSDKPKNSGGGAEDLLSKLFEMDENERPADSASNFSEETKVDSFLQSQVGKKELPEIQIADPNAPKQSLDDLLKTDVTTSNEPTGVKSVDLGEDLFDGIMDEDHSAAEKINLFSGVNEVPKADRTLVLETPASADTGQTEAILVPDDPAASSKVEFRDPIEAALLEYGDAEVSQSKDVPTEKFKRPVSAAKEVMPAAPSFKEFKPEGVESVSAGDFSESLSPANSKSIGTSPKPWQSKSVQWVVLGLGVATGIGLVIGSYLKLQTDAGLLGYRMEGFSFVQAYRPPTEEQQKDFERHFQAAETARLLDDPKKLEESIPGLKSILVSDERNLQAAAQLMEQSAILSLWYGLKSPWPAQYDEAQQKITAILEKTKATPSLSALDRAKAWRVLSLGDSERAFTELSTALSKFPNPDDEFISALIELSYLSGKKTETEKWIPKLTKKPGLRVQKIQALLKSDFDQMQELSSSGYLPAKIESLVHQKIEKESAEKLLAESELLVDELKTFPPLVAALRTYRGDLYAALGDGAKARDEWKAVLERSSEAGQIWFKLAKSYEDDAVWDDAVSAYREALKAKGLNEDGVLRFAKLLRLRGKVLDAVSTLDDALKANPKLATFYYEKGLVQLSIYQDDQAKAAFLKALEIDPKLELATLGLARMAMQRKEWTEAEKILNKIPSTSAHHSEVLLSLARIAKSRYRFDQAEKYTAEAIRENPRLETAYPQLVELYLMDERDEQALTMVKKGLEVLPRSPLLKVALGRIYQFQGNFEKALSELDFVRKNFAHLREVAYAVADILIDNKEISHAYEVINPLVEKDSNDPELQYLRAKAFVRDQETGRGVGSNEGAYKAIDLAIRKNGEEIRYRVLAAQLSLLLQDKSSAIEHLETALKLKSHHTQALLIRGDIYRDSGDYEHATQIYLSALKSTRFQSPIFGRLADGFKAQGKVPEAIQYYQKVVQSNPNDARAYLELGKLYSDEGRYMNAMKALSASVRLNSDKAEAYYFLGFAQKELGAKKEAIKSFERFLSMEPSGTEAATVRDEIYFLKGGSVH